MKIELNQFGKYFFEFFWIEWISLNKFINFSKKFDFSLNNDQIEFTYNKMEKKKKAESNNKQLGMN
jgi:hypothetical protein